MSEKVCMEHENRRIGTTLLRMEHKTEDWGRHNNNNNNAF